ncbi:DUF2855 family protein [uncultured Ilumatobacter sp.]|uniref:DUF2855 family protein n=1 Tax=uncultured Ilumatobacter sp. TaxID=879968 RepID=UPI00374EE22D
MDHALLVERKVIGNTQTVEVAEQPLDANQVRLRIDRFAVTANNITYAVFGDMLAYWEFFPAALPFGQVPAMGWAEVVESNNPDIAVGGRYYGWFPMASTTVITATLVSDGFRDDGAHRQPHAPVYRSYVDTKRDGMYDAADDGEDRHVLLRGLFLTGYLAEEFFADSGGGTDNGEPAYFGATQVVVLSASSKTAIGFAQRAAERGVAKVIGLTSAGNADFVRSLGYYDQVVSYDEVADIDASCATVSIDMAGNPTVLGAVHTHLGDQLKYSMTVGRSHHDAPDVDAANAAQLPGPQPQLFFAPSEVGRRLEQWGREAYQQRCADALASFVEGSRSWLSIDHRTGSDGAAAAWADVHDGNVAPSVGVVVLPNA